MGRRRHSDSVNLFRLFGGLDFPPLLDSGIWRGEYTGVTGGLKAACTLLGAGAVGALLLLKYSPNSVFSSRFHFKSQNPLLSSEDCISIEDEEELTVPGLQNSGNNCFLNVVLQALASSKAFLSFIEMCTDLASKAEMKSGMTFSKGPGPVSMPLAVSVSSLMKELSQLVKVPCTSSPRRVILALRSYAKDFDLASQQDAAEALVHLACAIQEENDHYLEWLKPTFQSFAMASLGHGEGSPCGPQEGLKGRRGGDRLIESWRGHPHWPLEGTLASSLTCQRCGHQYTTQIQFFNDISLSPLQDQEGDIIQGCTLENCLEQFTEPEWIDSVKCSSCSHETAVFSLCSASRDSTFITFSGSGSEECLDAARRHLERCSYKRDEKAKAWSLSSGCLFPDSAGGNQ